MGEVQAKQRDCNLCFLERVCISFSWEQLLFCHSGVPVHGVTELQVQRLSSVCVCWERAILSPAWAPHWNHSLWKWPEEP